MIKFIISQLTKLSIKYLNVVHEDDLDNAMDLLGAQKELNAELKEKLRYEIELRRNAYGLLKRTTNQLIQRSHSLNKTKKKLHDATQMNRRKSS